MARQRNRRKHCQSSQLNILHTVASSCTKMAKIGLMLKTCKSDQVFQLVWSLAQQSVTVIIKSWIHSTVCVCVCVYYCMHACVISSARMCDSSGKYVSVCVCLCLCLCVCVCVCVCVCYSEPILPMWFAWWQPWRTTDWLWLSFDKHALV